MNPPSNLSKTTTNPSPKPPRDLSRQELVNKIIAHIESMDREDPNRSYFALLAAGLRYFEVEPSNYWYEIFEGLKSGEYDQNAVDWIFCEMAIIPDEELHCTEDVWDSLIVDLSRIATTIERRVDIRLLADARIAFVRWLDACAENTHKDNCEMLAFIERVASKQISTFVELEHWRAITLRVMSDTYPNFDEFIKACIPREMQAQMALELSRRMHNVPADA